MVVDVWRISNEDDEATTRKNSERAKVVIAEAADVICRVHLVLKRV
jgi:hypothetical protein